MATNYVKASYNEIYDFGTKSGNTTIVGIHTPTVDSSGSSKPGPYVMLQGFFNQFRKFRYAGARVSLVPAAQLPADPLQVSFEAGQPTIDPRDLLNPILFHGCHGESLSVALNNIFTDQNHDFELDSSVTNDLPSTSTIGNEYYSALSDKTWRKFGVQRPAILPFLTPRVWKTATTFPMVGKSGKMESYDTMKAIHDQLVALGQAGLDESMVHNGTMFSPAMEWFANIDGSTAVGYYSQTFMSNGLARLGWLPTTVSKQVEDSSSTPTAVSGMPVRPNPLLPKIFMGVLMFPPSYTQELYFRMTITHYFEFKDFQGVSLGGGVPNDAYNENLPEIGSQSLSIEALNSGDIKLTTSGVS